MPDTLLEIPVEITAKNKHQSYCQNIPEAGDLTRFRRYAFSVRVGSDLGCCTLIMSNLRGFADEVILWNLRFRFTVNIPRRNYLIVIY